MSTPTPHIEITLGICGGKPRIAGHRIRVQDVVLWHEQLGLSPDEMISQHPGISLADVYAALSYYHDHRDEIRSDLETERAYIESVRSRTPSKLLEKLIERNARADAVSS